MGSHEASRHEGSSRGTSGHEGHEGHGTSGHEGNEGHEGHEEEGSHEAPRHEGCGTSGHEGHEGYEGHEVRILLILSQKIVHNCSSALKLCPHKLIDIVPKC